MTFISLGLAIILAFGWQYYAFLSKNPKIKTQNSPYKIVSPRWEIMGGFLTCLPIYLLYSLQYSMHSDYNNYYNLFLNIQSNKSQIRDTLSQIIFQIIGNLNLPFQTVLFAFYCVAFTFLFKCIYDYSSQFASSILLFFGAFLTLGFLQMRQFPAVAIVFFAYRYIEHRKFLPYCFFILIATGFHLSAIIMLPFYFILQIQFKASYYIMIFGSLAFCNIFQQPLLIFVTQNFLPQYYGRHEMFRNTIFNKVDIALIVIIMFFVLIYYIPITAQKGINTVLVNSYFLYFIMFFTCRWIPEIDRFGYYFYLPIIVLIPNLLSCEKNKDQRRFLSLAIPVLLFLICLYKTKTSAFWTNYVSIFQ